MGMVWKGVKSAAKVVGKGVKAVSTTKLAGKALDDATFYERIIGRKANALGVAGITGIAMAGQTVNAMVGSDSNIAKLGYTSVGENLDRLVSYDGSGFVRNINRVSGGDPEVMQDIVKNTFNNPNQFGATGDLVFALHNTREG